MQALKICCSFVFVFLIKVLMNKGKYYINHLLVTSIYCLVVVMKKIKKTVLSCLYII